MTDLKINEKERSKIAKKVTLVGFFTNVVLTIVKIIAGLVGNSCAMFADGIHSLSDFFTDIIVLVGFKFTEKPADGDHNYGHGKYETFATFVIGLILMFAGYNILQNGLVNIFNIVIEHQPYQSPELITLIVALLSIVSKEILYRYTKKYGENINSSALIANGWHHRSDALSSVGTLIGISLAYFGGENWAIFDPIAAVVVSIFIFKVAFEIIVPSINELLEVALPKKDVKYILKQIKMHEDILDVHNLRTRRIGTTIAIEAHLVFEGNISLDLAHKNSDIIERELKQYFGYNCIITFHLEPNITG
jgi:cation diffusion facilitator family transporter